MRGAVAVNSALESLGRIATLETHLSGSLFSHSALFLDFLLTAPTTRGEPRAARKAGWLTLKSAVALKPEQLRRRATRAWP